MCSATSCLGFTQERVATAASPDSPITWGEAGKLPLTVSSTFPSPMRVVNAPVGRSFGHFLPVRYLNMARNLASIGLQRPIKA